MSTKEKTSATYGKFRKFAFELPSGEVRQLRVVEIKNLDNLSVCETCPYEKLCSSIPDPRDPNNKEKGFESLCMEITLPDGDEGAELRPVLDSIEECFPDFDTLVGKLVFGNNAQVPIKKLVNTLCPDWCELYEEDHSRCNISSHSCILRHVFEVEDKNVELSEN